MSTLSYPNYTIITVNSYIFSIFAAIMNKTVITICLSALLTIPMVAQRPSSSSSSSSEKNNEVKESDIKQEIYAWKIIPPLGLREPAPVDTSLLNYGQRSVPVSLGPAYAITGNLGGPGETLIYFDRQPTSEFMFKDAVAAWLPSLSTHEFFNSRIPLTFLSYNTAGTRDNSQDRLSATFSGNINKKAQIGAMFDYLYSKGCYDFQAVKGLTWGFSGSYIGDRYEMQAFYNHWNTLGKENGGITDDLYITDPAQLQGGQTSIQAKSIPTRLTGAFNRVVGGELYMNNAYKVGFWKDVEVDDSTTVEEFVPVSSFSWTLNYKTGRRKFTDTGSADNSFWENTYFNLDGSSDETKYWSLTNTVGVSLLEEFNKFAKFGLTAFVTHEIRKYNQYHDTIPDDDKRPEGLTPYPVSSAAVKGTQNLLWVGGQLTKQRGSILTYEATARFGLLGSSIGDIDIDGNVSTRFRLFGDSVTITGYGEFHNTEAPYLLNHYVSNHFIWENNFGKIRRLRFGGKLNIPHTRTFVNVGVENVQNLIYFNSACMPVQNSGSVQVFSASLNQNFKFGPLHWDNRITYQETSDAAVIPLPRLSVYSNLYLRFMVARVLDVQFGVDCDYYTKYKAVDYQPATMSFYNQREIDCGNYPFMNAYVNMKLSKARFYIMFSHVNQGLTGNNYFSMPHYPLNPRRFQMGVSIDFAN